jgi:TrwC relaxase
MRERRPGVWELIVQLPRDPTQARARQLSRTVHGTKREAQRALAGLISQGVRGEGVMTAAPGELPRVCSGRQADGLGLCGPVTVEALEILLSGRDPVSGIPLGRELLDRFTSDGRMIKAVSGFDATFSAPKSLSVWWALTGDRRLLEAHDVAVSAALEHLQRFGSTTRIRCNGGRLHPDTNGLTMATFRQTTSRADDPQIHTHAVISAKVQTPDGRWYALDARYLKRHQRMLGGLYQSVLRAELTDRFGVEWRPIVSGRVLARISVPTRSARGSKHLIAASPCGALPSRRCRTRGPARYSRRLRTPGRAGGAGGGPTLRKCRDR